MIVLYMELQFSFFEVFSLKERRSIVKKLKDRLRNKYNVSVAEKSRQNNFRYTIIGIVSISDDKNYLLQLREKIINFIDSFPEFEATILVQELL